MSNQNIASQDIAIETLNKNIPNLHNHDLRKSGFVLKEI